MFKKKVSLSHWQGVRRAVIKILAASMDQGQKYPARIYHFATKNKPKMSSCSHFSKKGLVMRIMLTFDSHLTHPLAILPGLLHKLEHKNKG